MIVIDPPSSGSGHTATGGVHRPELQRFVKKAQKKIGLAGDVTVLLTDDARMRALNRSFRGKNKSTDVLSFPAAENGEGVAGDLAISLPIAAEQAEAHGHSLMAELQILSLHGLLHLAGLDHEADQGEMQARELAMRDHFDLPATLIERAAAPNQPSAPGAEPGKVRGRTPEQTTTHLPEKPATKASGMPATKAPGKPATKATKASGKPATKAPEKPAGTSPGKVGRADTSTRSARAATVPRRPPPKRSGKRSADPAAKARP